MFLVAILPCFWIEHHKKLAQLYIRLFSCKVKGPSFTLGAGNVKIFEKIGKWGPKEMGTDIDRIHAALEKEHCPKVDIHYNTMFTLVFLRSTYSKTDETPESTRKNRR